jgi:hypothetical protein
MDGVGNGNVWDWERVEGADSVEADTLMKLSSPLRSP